MNETPETEINVASLIEGREYIIRWTSKNAAIMGLECSAVGKWTPGWNAFCFVLGNRSYMMRPNVDVQSATLVEDMEEPRSLIQELVVSLEDCSSYGGDPVDYESVSKATALITKAEAWLGIEEDEWEEKQ